MDIVENLQRAELSPADRLQHMARRAVIWERKKKEQDLADITGQNSASNKNAGLDRAHRLIEADTRSVLSVPGRQAIRQRR